MYVNIILVQIKIIFALCLIRYVLFYVQSFGWIRKFGCKFSAKSCMRMKLRRYTRFILIVVMSGYINRSLLVKCVVGRP